MRRTIANTLVQILGKMMTVAVSLITTGILTRKLGLDSYGGLVLISSMFVFLDSLADFGTKTIGVREVAREKDGRMWRELMVFRLMLAGISYVVGLVVVWGWSGFEGMRWEATVSMLMIFLTSVAGLGEMVWQNQLKMQMKVAVDMIYPLLFLLALLTRSKVTLMWVMTTYLLAKIVSIGLELRLVKELRESFEGKVEAKAIRKWWTMTWPMGVFLLVFATYDRLVDSMMIRHYLGVAEVAWYGLAYKIYAVLVQPAYFLVNSVFPQLSSRIGNRRKVFYQSMGLLLLGGGVVVWGTQIMAGWVVVKLGGSEFYPAAEVLRILSWGCLFSYLGHLVGFSLVSQGGQKELLKLSLVTLVFNLTLNWWLIPRWGVNGAAYVTVATEALGMGLMGWFLKLKLAK